MPDYVCNCTSSDTNGVDHGKLTSWKESGRNLNILFSVSTLKYVVVRVSGINGKIAKLRF